MWQGESGGTRLDWMLRDSIVYRNTQGLDQSIAPKWKPHIRSITLESAEWGWNPKLGSY